MWKQAILSLPALVLLIMTSEGNSSTCGGQVLRSLEPLTQGADHGKLPPALSRTPDKALDAIKVTDIGRLRENARILHPGPPGTSSASALRSLPNGTYVYLVDEQGRVAISNRSIPPSRWSADGAPAEPFVGSHEGLFRLFEAESGGRPPQVVAAGEIIVRDSEVLALSNGSGTFRGQAAHLEHAERRLEALGLALTPETKKLDYSTGRIADPHAGVRRQLEQEYRFARDPGLNRLWEETRKSSKAFHARYRTDDDLIQLMLSRMGDPDTGKLVTALVQFSNQWRGGLEGEASLIEAQLLSQGEAAFRRMLQLMNHLAQGH